MIPACGHLPYYRLQTAPTELQTFLSDYKKTADTVFTSQVTKACLQNKLLFKCPSQVCVWYCHLYEEDSHSTAFFHLRFHI